MILYFFIVYKLAISASPEQLIGNQLVMSDIALFGALIIPLGLMASTASSALGSVMVAPRTLQALASDKSFPGKKLNLFLSKGKGTENEPFNASLLTCIIAMVFVILGNVNIVAQIITMFFMITYGSLCLISFLYHFGSDPSFRPSFKSKWYISLIGAVMCIWLMFKINTAYTLASLVAISLIYIYISYVHKERRGMQSLFRSVILQLTRNLHVYIQKTKKTQAKYSWRPAAICVSENAFENRKSLDLLNWISYKYGFGTYMHLIQGYFSKNTNTEAQKVLDELLQLTEDKNSNVYLDTIISPSYTSAIAQIIQLPSISGLDNNMIIFDYRKNDKGKLTNILENYSLVRAGNFDVCILSAAKKEILKKKEIHVWIKSIDFINSNLMILLSYIILGHPYWKKAKLKIFDICLENEVEEARENMKQIVQEGRLPISYKNIELIKKNPDVNSKSIINYRSKDATLTLIGFYGDQVKHDGNNLFDGYESIGDILFVNARQKKEL